MTVTDTQSPDRNQATNAVSRGEISAPDYDELRNEMRRAIEEARPKIEIIKIFLRATDISDRAAASEAFHKKRKDTEGHAEFRAIGLRVDLLRAQWLQDLEKAGRRFMGRPIEGVKIGTPPDPDLIVLTDLFPRLSQDQARGESQDLQLLRKMMEAAFEALVADPTAPRPRWGPQKRIVSLSAIRVDERAQPRAALDMDKVAEYAEAMQRGAKFPAPTVFEDAAEAVFWPGDGHHRIAAATKLKLKTIECEVRSGGLREAILYSCGANATHGLPRTRDDKHRAVTKMLNDDVWSGWSDREIARRCKVGADLVGKIREQLKLVTVANDSEPDTVVNDSMNSPSHTDERTFIHSKTGKPATMRTGNIGRKPIELPAPESAAKEPMKRDNPPQTAPDQPTPTPEEAAAERKALYARNEQTAPDGDADLPTYFGPSRRQISLDERLGNLIFLTEQGIERFVPEMRAAGRLSELFRRVRKLIDKIEAGAAVDDCNVAIDHATPVQEQMPPTPTSPDLPPAA